MTASTDDEAEASSRAMNESMNGAGAAERHDDAEPDYSNMSEQEFEHFLTMAIDGYADIMETPCKAIRTFSEAGVLTNNRGLVVQIGDAEFQLTIVRR